MKSLGADSIEEAMNIMQAAGLKPEDIPGLLMNNGMQPNVPQKPIISMEPPKLTRKQEMGIDPIPPELMA